MKIDFLRHPDVGDWWPAPNPAKHHVPGWLQSMPKRSDESYPHDKWPTGGVNRTAKSCMPMLDAVQAGYMLTTPCDLVFHHEFETPHPQESGYRQQRVSWGNFPLPVVEKSHHKNQYPTLPTEGIEVLTFKNPFGVVTPPGYSTMFKPPAGSLAPFSIFEGIVDTDAYNHPVLLPFVLSEKFTGMIPMGTPIAQIIPFRREKWDSETVEKDTQHHFKDLFRTIAAYRKKAWSKKEYR